MMATQPQQPGPDTNGVVRIGVDRIQVAVKSLWRLLLAGLLLGAAILIGLEIGSWKLLWQQQPATFIALAIIMATLAVAGVLTTVNGIRWLLMATWPKHLGVRIDAATIDAALGPFGHREYAWRDLQCKIAEGFDAEMLAQVHDGTFTPVLYDAREKRDVYAWMQAHSGAEPESLTRALRPYLEAHLSSEPQV